VASISRAALSSVTLALHRLSRLARPRPEVRILYYHSISDDPVRSSVSPPAFEAQMEYLRRSRYRPLSLSEAARRLTSRGNLPEQSVVITLDDGFRDNYERAFPVLARLGFPATVFLTASYIGTDRLPTLTRTDFVPRPLDWGQVKEMHAHGIEFGSHTLTHPMLSQLQPGEARREIAESRRVIEDRLGAPAPLFCYPRGDFNEAVKRIVREEGYVAACTTLPGVNDWRTDPFALRRTYVSRRDTPREFAKKVRGAYDLLQRSGLAWKRLRAR
jgi:peptidoglycan/xylan/chitin deacetylase (PgdA/CDA1 family)